MDIECQGCYYTLCSFVCLTEDLSEILKFLWRHGCLRRSYSCEKCGRKCAIGDKDLFFRCNRNLVDAPEVDVAMQEPSPHHSASEPQPPPPPSNGHPLQLDYQEMQNQYILHHGDHRLSFHDSVNMLHRSNVVIHPALRHSAPLPGDPLPPTHPSPVFQAIDRHFMLGHDSMLHCGERHVPVMHVADLSTDRDDKILTMMDRHPAIIQSVQVDDIGSLPDSELADLDVQTKVCKKTKNGSPSRSLGLKKRCNFKVSMKKGTFFEKSKLPLDTVCKYVVFWCCMKHPTQEFLRNELSLATRTVVEWSKTCREICTHWAKSNSEKIGGDGVIVQVDEVKIAAPTPKMGDTSDGNTRRYSFWGIEKDKEKGKIFVVPVNACDAWTLLNVVNDWILPGSVIISNCWKAYDCLKLPEYVQQTVVQSKTFVHPPSNQGEISFDEQCDDPNNRRKIDDMHMPRFGTRRSHHLGDLAEFMFKRRYNNHLERMHAFFKQVAMVYPLR